MGEAEQVLRQVLEIKRMSQTRSVIMMRVGRSTVHDWFNRSAAKEFVRSYLGDIVELEDDADSALPWR